MNETHVSARRCGTSPTVFLASLLVCLLSGAALAKDGGFRLEAGPDMSYARYSDGSTQDWAVSAFLGIDVWGGPFGAILQARKGTRISQVAITDQGLTPALTLTSQVDIGPSFNITPGPVHVRVAVGPWFAHSEERNDALSDLDLSGFWMDWSRLRLMGAMAEARMDLNLPLLSPFAILAVHSQNSTLVLGQSYGSDPGDYTGREVRATAGLRLNVIPIVKLAVAGFAGQSQHVLRTDDSGRTQTWEVVGRSYGLSVWATMKL